MSNPLEDFLEDFGSTPTQEKTAFSFPSALKSIPGRVGEGVLSGAGAALAGAMVAGVGVSAAKIYGAATKSRDFRRMMDHNPDLREHHERDPKTFNQMFSSLRTMNPSFSRDPIVSGTYMRRMTENPLTAGGILTETVSARDKFPSLTDQFANAGASAAGKAVSTYKSPEPPDPLADLRGRAEEARLLSTEADYKGKLDAARLAQQRRDQIRRLRGLP